MKFEQKMLLIGGVAGALLGLAAAYLYIKNNEDRQEPAAKVTPMQALGLGASLVALLRQVAGLGQG